MGMGPDLTRDPWISSQNRICWQTRYWCTLLLLIWCHSYDLKRRKLFCQYTWNKIKVKCKKGHCEPQHEQTQLYYLWTTKMQNIQHIIVACSKLSQRSPIYVYTMLLEFGSVSNWNALFQHWFTLLFISGCIWKLDLFFHYIMIFQKMSLLLFWKREYIYPVRNVCRIGLENVTTRGKLVWRMYSSVGSKERKYNSKVHVSFVFARKISLWTKCLVFIYMYTVILNEN